ncbi:MAG TPA: bifunctional nuclease family protein [Pirellulales bacterium]|nr:bifunctional nuclease family protein [Pirellulales bacterium]
MARFHLAWIKNRHCEVEQHLCEAHARDVLTSSPLSFSRFTGKREVLEGARQFEIGMVLISEINDQQVIYLYDVDNGRLFPLLIGIFEATSLDRRLKGLISPRPLTHDAWTDTIRVLDAEVQHVLIARLRDHTYFAEARVRHQGRIKIVDLRPSDAFNLALLFDRPIFISNEVLSQLSASGDIK